MALTGLAALLMPQAIRGQSYPGASGPEGPAPVAVGYSGVSPQTEVTADVGISAIYSYVQSAEPGDMVTVEIVVQNLGTGVAWFPLTLLETNTGSALTSVTLTMQAGQEITLGLNWDTSGAAPQDYYLAALAGLEGDQNPDNDFMALAWPITLTTPGITLGDELGIEVPDASFGGSLSLPEIETMPVSPLAQIRLGDSEGLDLPDASFGGSLLVAEIGTLAISLRTEIKLGDDEGLDLPDASFGGSLLVAEIGTLAISLRTEIKLGDDEGLEVPDASFGGSLLVAEIGTLAISLRTEIKLGDDEGLEVPDASFGGSLLAAEIDTLSVPYRAEIKLGDDEGLDAPDASFGVSLIPTEIGTIAVPGQLDIVFGDELGIEFPDGSFGDGLPLPDIDTPARPSAAPFVGNADARYTGVLAPVGIGTLGTPPPGTIQGLVRLESRKTSLGAFWEVGEEVYPVEANGRYKIKVASDPVDILIKAPGYLSALIPQVQVPPGEAVDIPRVTLRFGDGNDDGRIDIVDLNMAARNFGETIEEAAPP